MATVLMWPISLASWFFDLPDKAGTFYAEQDIGENKRLTQEGQLLDNKSLRSVTGKTADWGELAKDCISFANAA